ncbi:hypothetical protein CPB85DRAFT_1221751 [Mucidula mucida]|nr:hypothetical protein CPB85DRAFT_1221751 [Mucidula mucida]
MHLHCVPFVFDSPKGISSKGSLKMTAKRYTYGASQDNNVCGITLLLAHCIGSHKEQWEPTLERIFTIQQSKNQFHRIREAWAFDWQNHGDAAVLNQSALSDRPEGVCASLSVSAFVRSPRMTGHRIVPLGHSAGAGAMMLTTRGTLLSELPYAALVLIEPTMIPEELFYAHFDDRMANMAVMVGATSLRRDSWPSRNDAFLWFERKFPWKTWDPRALRLLVDHGLQDCPGGVKLKCDRKQEAVSYPDVDGHFEATTELGRVCHALPIHVIWGTTNSLV